MQKLELNEKYLYSIMGYGSVSSYGHKVFMEMQHVFRGTTLSQ